MALALGTRIAGYEIGAPIGAGGMGEVYRARDVRLKRDVAIKILAIDVARVSIDGGTYPVWSRTRSELLYATPDHHIMAVTYVAEGEPFRANKPRLWSAIPFLRRLRSLGSNKGRPFDLHPDGERIAMAPVPDGGSTGRPDTLVFASGFMEELRAVVPRSQ